MQGIMMLVVFAYYIVVFLVAIVNYVLTSLAIHKLGKRRGISNPWLAWIPIASSYAIGAIVDEYDGRFGFKKRWAKTLLSLGITEIAVLVGMVGTIIVMSFAMLGIESSSSSDLGMASVIIVLIMMAFYFVLLFVVMAYMICGTICIYKIFESTVPEKSLKYMILSIVIPFAGCILLFKCRNQGYPLPEDGDFQQDMEYQQSLNQYQDVQYQQSEKYSNVSNQQKQSHQSSMVSNVQAENSTEESQQ